MMTGGCGFIGSAVCRMAAARGHQIINIDCLTYAANPKNVEMIKGPNYIFENIDIRDRHAVNNAIELHQPDAIMHLAAESHVDRSIDGPASFIETNIIGTFNLLQAARNYWDRLENEAKDTFRFHHISTDEVKMLEIGSMWMIMQTLYSLFSKKEKLVGLIILAEIMSAAIWN